MNRLAYFYYTGVGVPQDKKQAYALFRKAFAKGHLRAGTALGLLYLFDENDLDKKEGFRITKKAADAGRGSSWSVTILPKSIERNGSSSRMSSVNFCLEWGNCSILP